MRKCKTIWMAFCILFVAFNVHAKEIKFDLDKDKPLWITWAQSDGSDVEIFCRKYEKNHWEDTIQVTHNDTLDTTPHIAIAPDGNPWVVWSGEDGAHSSIFVSKFVEGSFTNPMLICDLDAYSDISPFITFSDDGVAWVVWAGSDGVSDNIYYVKENRAGWTSEKQIHESNQVPDIDPIIVQRDDSQMMVVWSQYNGTEYKQVISYLNGGRWSKEQTLVSSDVSIGEEFSSVINQNNELQLLWVNLQRQTFSQPIDSVTADYPEKFLFNVESIDLFSGISPDVLERCFVSWKDQQQNNQSLRGKHIFFSLNTNSTPLKMAKKNVSDSKKIWLAFLKTTGLVMDEAYAAVDTNKFIAFGDSITYGVTGIEGQTSYTGYPALLQAKLGKTVSNRGVSGERTSGGLARIDSVLSAENAGYLLLLEGTNDLAERSTDTIIFNLGQLIDRSLAFGTTPIIATLLPRTDGYNSAGVRVNNLIPSLAAEKGIEYVDMYSVFEPLDKDAYYGDRRLHPNDQGYEIMANTWHQKITSILGGGDSGGGGGGCGYIKPSDTNGSNLNMVLILFVVLMIVVQRLKLAYGKVS